MSRIGDRARSSRIYLRGPVNVVLMDNRRHRTVDLPVVGRSILVPVSTMSWWKTDCAVFKPYGWLAGDPIFLQTSGPTLPDWWWTGQRQIGPYGTDIPAITEAS